MFSPSNRGVSRATALLCAMTGASVIPTVVDAQEQQVGREDQTLTEVVVTGTRIVHRGTRWNPT